MLLTLAGGSNEGASQAPLFPSSRFSVNGFDAFEARLSSPGS